MNLVVPSSKVVVIGAGMAGASCARTLAQAGCTVQVVDKARGVGGRLATRRLEWLDARGHRQTARLDHGAPAITACGTEFRQFLACAAQAGLVTPWQPALAAGSRALDEAGTLYLPTQDMPWLCRWLLRDIPTTLSFAVDGLRRSPRGWQIEVGGSTLPGHFDAVVLALPPAQAATLLAPQRSDWAQRASIALMQPCWTLMGVAHRPARPIDWNVERPEQGPLAWVMRNDARPGREPASDAAHWVAHARGGWSRQQLEQPADWVLGRLQAALQDCLGEPIEWRHAVVHRWRYAKPQPSGAAPVRLGWWDAVLGLGVCGDFLSGSGAEGAWLSAQALSEAMLEDMRPPRAAPQTLPPQRYAA
jgi:predicted NAD/FAD-dependent oxidoreductase